MKTLSAPTEEVINKISLKPLVSDITVIGNTLEFKYSGTDDQLTELVNELLDEGIHFTSFGFRKDNLESVFMNVTKGIVQ